MKKLITFLTVLALFLTLTGTASAALPEGLVGWWKLDENITDSTTNDLNGSVLEGTATYVDHDDFGKALDFDTSYYANVADNDLLEPASITLEAWVKRDKTPGNYKHIITKGAFSCSSGIYAFYTGSSGGIAFYIRTSTGYKLTPQVAATSIWDNKWHHVAGTYDGASVKLYVDGEFKGETTTTGAIVYDANPLLFGRYGGQCAAYDYFKYDGYLDDVRIWNKALSQDRLSFFDQDNDGVYGEEDFCPDTKLDVPTLGLGTNRWAWNEHVWASQEPENSGKGNQQRVNQNPGFTMDMTLSCSCTQILDLIKGLTTTEDNEMMGHYKYGCSKSILDEFIEDGKDGIIDGYNLIGEPMETFAVLANKVEPKLSSELTEGKKYMFKAHETALAGDSITFDAMCSIRPPTATAWTDIVSHYESSGPELLELFVDGEFGKWGDTCNDADHTYYYEYTGTGSPASFHIFDTFPSNNSGELKVDIYQKLY